MAIVFTENMLVGPHMPEVNPSGTRVGTLPVTRANGTPIPPGVDEAFFQANTRLTIGPASGDIGSGVLFTGRTPPRGWDMPADSPEWLYFTSEDTGRSDAWRYSLIGALVPGTRPPNPDEWFYIGDEAIVLIGDPSPNWDEAHPPMGFTRETWPGLPSEWKRLWLACNRRAHIGELNDGNGYWSVPIIVEAFTDSFGPPRPDCSAAMPRTRSRACIAIVNTMHRLSTQTQGVCADITRLRNSMSDRSGALIGTATALGVVVTIVGALAIATIPPSNFVFHLTHATVGTIVAASAGAGVGGTVAALTAYGTQLEGWLAVLITAGTALLGSAAAAGVIAFGANWWALLGYSLLVALGFGLLFALIAMLGEQLRQARILEQQLRAVIGLQTNWDRALDVARMECCEAALHPEETVRPVCA